jgi:hypothetical protein
MPTPALDDGLRLAPLNDDLAVEQVYHALEIWVECLV